jgi:TPR repeat protein
MTHQPSESNLNNVSRLIEAGRPEDAYRRCATLAESGSTAARLYLGWMYQLGKGVKRNLEEAERCYNSVLISESPKAEFYMATLQWEKGDPLKTVEWFERSASSGYAPAMYQLSKMYRYGYGVPIDSVRGRKLLDQAASKGHLFAQRDVAREMIRGRRGIARIPSGLFCFWLCSGVG